jgi:formate hydrogenlyase subunit 3/multisubunit Na+/H+ antiporter MnhD subunit
MNGANALLALALAAPFALLLACISRRARARMPSLLALAPVPALAAAALASGSPPLLLPNALLGATLALDTPGAMLLGAAALLWIAAGAYADTYMRNYANARSFAVWWLLALLGNIGVFMAADIASFYLFFAVGSLSAYGLIVHGGTPRMRKAGAVYVGLALLGEACVLMGLVLLAAAAPSDDLLIREAAAALPASPWRDLTLLLLIAGFGIKIGLVPGHVWMPLAYSAAPIPAAAVLSGAAVKAGVIGFIRFMPLGVALPDWGNTLVTAGLISAFYGVAIGITQSNPKAILAYSSVSQMGLIAVVLGMGLASGDGGTGSAAAFYAAHHVLAKGALFLAIGVIAAAGARGPWPVLFPAAAIALGLAGLPFTGGALAKVAVKPFFDEGLAGVLAALSAAGTALLMLHFLQRLEATAPEEREETEDVSPAGLSLPCLAMAFASLAVPWALFPSLVPGGLAEVFSLRGLWASVWPVLLGGAMAFAFWRWPQRLPRIPEGDLAQAIDGAVRGARACGRAFERTDVVLRQWPVAGVSLVTLTVALGVAIAVGS